MSSWRVGVGNVVLLGGFIKGGALRRALIRSRVRALFAGMNIRE